MKLNFLCAACLAATLAACANTPIKTVEPAAKAETTALKSLPMPKKVTPKPEVRERQLPVQELDDDKLYAFLVGEIANQRGQGAVASEAYLDLAKSTRDPRIAERATQIALAARQLPKALVAAQLWKELDPGATNASQTVTALLVSQGKLGEAAVPLKALIASEGSEAGNTFVQMNALLAKQTDKAGVLQLVRDVAKGYEKLPESHFAIAQAALNAKQFDVVKNETIIALKLKPDWEQAAILHSDALRQIEGKTNSATAFLKNFVAANKGAREARLSLAQMYAADKNFPAARAEFESIVGGTSNNPDLMVAIALLLYQNGDNEGAEKYFNQAKANNYKEPDLIQVYVGQMHEDAKRYDDAIAAYKLVGQGQQYFPAQLKIAAMLGKQNKIDVARAHLKTLQAENPEQRGQIILAETAMLRDAKRNQEAYDLLNRAIAEQPQSQDLLYDRAMVAEKLEKFDVLEKDLRLLMQIAPDYAHAYNALGYTFAERNIRLPEALQLIEKAHALSPDDPFIQDSLGWVYFRMGNLDKAATILKDAYAKKPDAEIAAHLGEVLWAQGARDEAMKLLTASMKEHPENESLEATIKKLKK